MMVGESESDRVKDSDAETATIREIQQIVQRCTENTEAQLPSAEKQQRTIA